MTGLTKLLDNF